MTRARFIAGAICRACGASDRIVVEEREGVRLQRCVACRHEETIARADPSADELASTDPTVSIVRIRRAGKGVD